ncbi:hypothetical protein DPX16_8899 [Anabarilius grahami]|uniref:Uncharacterized protein n=1 Tax=Anabarilius grahami TaxID=495550 RepID=A0A3N0YD16_ANAGA|nr:hypothetical protein DPX16_8899 [Anabarilius grahami]
MLLQSTALPKQLYLAKEPLPEVRELPAAPAQHGHENMEFEEPENKEGEAFICKRISNRSTSPSVYQFLSLPSLCPLPSSSRLITYHHKLVPLLSPGSAPGEGRKLLKRMRNERLG